MVGRELSTLSSLASIVPEPSASNRSNASLISCFCSSVNSFFGTKEKVTTPLNAEFVLNLPDFFLAARDGGFLYACSSHIHITRAVIKKMHSNAP